MENNYKLFLKSFFNDKKEYQEKEVNGFWLIKQVHGATRECIYALYTPESYKKYRMFNTYNSI